MVLLFTFVTLSERELVHVILTDIAPQQFVIEKYIFIMSPYLNKAGLNFIVLYLTTIVFAGYCFLVILDSILFSP